MADANPAWTHAPWAGVPQAASAHVTNGHGQRPVPPPLAPSSSSTDMPPPPLHWKAFFSTTAEVSVGPDVFRVYRAAGSARTPASPLLLLLHGAGYSGLTWAHMVRALLALCPACQVAALDLRGHGATRCEDGSDLSVGRLTADVVAVAAALTAESPQAPLVLVGHSLGGALACHAAARLGSLAGLLVLDCVEGTALDSLETMAAAAAAIPQRFRDSADALSWAVRSGMSRNAEAASMSLAAQLQPAAGGGLEWRRRLSDTIQHWPGWFRGVGDAFLTAPCSGKLLLLPACERLDAALTVAQMKGRFQLLLLPNAGHAMQEDEPEAVARALASFIRRYVTRPATLDVLFRA